MDSAALQKYLLRLFEQHDLELDADEDGWLVTDGDFPAIRAEWHEGAAGEPGRLDARRAFEHGAFHVLLAACWYVTDERRMQITAWEIGVRTWDVFIGPFALHGVDATDMDML